MPDKGDFATAGFVDFQTKNVLEENFVKFEGAQFGTFRTVAGVNIFSPKNIQIPKAISEQNFSGPMDLLKVHKILIGSILLQKYRRD